MKKVRFITMLALSASIAGTTAPLLSSANASYSNATDQRMPTTTEVNLQDFDQYVGVKNNSFVLLTKGKQRLTNTQTETIKSALKQANYSIQQQHQIIDPQTKEVRSSTQVSGIRVLSAGVSGLSTKWFWWGERYYFKSNAAVSYISHRMRSQGDALGGLGVLSSVLANGVAAGIAGSGSLYFNHVANGLDYYNSIHIHSHIYMDMNYTGVYSFHTF